MGAALHWWYKPKHMIVWIKFCFVLFGLVWFGLVWGGWVGGVGWVGWGGLSVQYLPNYYMISC